MNVLLVWFRSSLCVAVALWASVDLGAQEVTLPLDRYEALRARAQARLEPPEPPAVPIAVESAELSVRAAAHSAHVRLRLALSLLDDGWQSVPLPALGNISAVEFGAWSGRVILEKSPALLVRGSGRQVVTVESVVEVAEDLASPRPTRTLRLALPRAATVTGTLVAPEGVEEVVFTSGAVGRRGSAPRTWTFVGERGGTMEARMMGAAPATERSRRPLRFDTVSAVLVRPSRTRRTAQAWIGVEVAQGRLERLRTRLPAGLEVVSVQGPPLAGWDVTAGVLEVTPLAPVTGALSFSVSLTGESGEAFEAPLLVAEGAARSRLLSGVALPPDGELQMASVGSARWAEPEDFEGVPESLHPTGARVLLVEDPRKAPQLAVAWSAQAEVLSAQVDRLLVDVVIGDSGRVAYQFWAAIRNQALTELAIAPPAGFELTGARRDGILLTPARSADGLLFPLRVGDQSQIIHVTGLLDLALPAESEAFVIPLPAFSSTVAQVEVRVVAPGGRAYAVTPPSQAGRVLPPPEVQVLEPTRGGGLATLRPRRAATGVAPPPLFAVPPGYVVTQAAWGALTARPGPLTLRIRPWRSKQEWF